MYQPVLDAVKALGIEPAAAEIALLPKNYIRLEGKAAQQMLKLMEALRGARRHQEGLDERRHRGKGDRGLVGVRIFGIDPGSERTGYGCVDTDGRRHRLVICGALPAPARSTFPDQLKTSTPGSPRCWPSTGPDCVAIENIFHAKNVRSALRLGHARGVALLAASAAGVPIVEYTPAEIKRAVVGYGRAEKHQVQQMVKLLLGLDARPVAARRRRRAGRRDLPPAHATGRSRSAVASRPARRASWRDYPPERRRRPDRRRSRRRP